MNTRGLFTATALPVVVHDVHERLTRAATNCVTAVRYIRRLAAAEPLLHDAHKVVLALGTDAFRLSVDAFPTPGVRRFVAAEQLEVLSGSAHTQLHEAFFAYFYSLLPAVLKWGEGVGYRWHGHEIDRLRQHCREAGEQHNDTYGAALRQRYARVDAACGRWWRRQREIAAAVDPAWLAVQIAPVAGAGLAPERIQPLVGDFLTLLLPAMRGELEQFHADSRRQGFFAANGSR